MQNLTVLEKVSIRLLQSNIFYASLLSQIRKIEVSGEMAKQIPTEAVGVRNGRIELYYNPQFLETLTLDEAKGVLEHEMKHLILSHLTRLRDESKINPLLVNIAQDIAANQDIPILPNGVVTVESFPKEWGIVENDTSEKYYEILKKNSNKISVSAGKNGESVVTITDSKGNVLEKFKVKQPFCHAKWGDGVGEQSELGKEIIRQAIQEAVQNTSKQRGVLPHGMEEAINEWLKPPVISWKAILKQFIASSIKSGYRNSWKRPNRRFGEAQKGITSSRNVAITIAVDTSGSISTADFQDFINEMLAIQSCYKSTITVLECDAKIQKEYKLVKYGKIDCKFKGRGGTSFKPVFDHIKEKRLKTDILIFFTDLYGDADTCSKPPYATIWVSTTANVSVPFGKILSLKNNPSASLN